MFLESFKKPWNPEPCFWRHCIKWYSLVTITVEDVIKSIDNPMILDHKVQINWQLNNFTGLDWAVPHGHIPGFFLDTETVYYEQTSQVQTGRPRHWSRLHSRSYASLSRGTTWVTVSIREKRGGSGEGMNAVLCNSAGYNNRPRSVPVGLHPILELDPQKLPLKYLLLWLFVIFSTLQRVQADV